MNSAPAISFNRTIVIKLLIVLAVATTMIGLVAMRVHGVNGADYHTWYWRCLDGWTLYPLMALAAAPFVLGQWLRTRRSTYPALCLLMLSTFLLQLAAIFPQNPPRLMRIDSLVNSSVNTSYYDAARVFQRNGYGLTDWLSLYPDLLPYMHFHARYKPPGLVLYWVVMIKLFGVGVAGRMTGGILLAALATAGIPATYLLVRRLGDDAQAAWCAASCMALLPALILFFPQFDQIYPPIACGMILLWRQAMQGRWSWGVAFGAILFLATMLSYMLLIIGLFLVVDTLLHLARTNSAGLLRVLRAAGLAVVTCLVLYELLWLTTGFDPIATFQVSARLQETDLIKLARPFPAHMIWDVYDFCLGSGWICYLLVVFLLIDARRSIPPRARRLVFLSLLQIITLASMALLPGEAARLWMPLYPLLMVPVGFELARWPIRGRWIVYGVLLLLTSIIAQNMLFLNMGEGHH